MISYCENTDTVKMYEAANVFHSNITYSKDFSLKRKKLYEMV